MDYDSRKPTEHDIFFISQGREVVNNTKDICFFVIYLFFMKQQ